MKISVVHVGIILIKVNKVIFMLMRIRCDDVDEGNDDEDDGVADDDDDYIITKQITEECIMIMFETLWVYTYI